MKEVISEKQIKESVISLANNISHYYKDSYNLVLLVILKGSIYFASDLSRNITVDHTLEFVEVSSYRDLMESGNIEFVTKINNMNLTNKDILIVEDIVDSGKTLYNVVNEISKSNKPNSIRVATLIDRLHKREFDVKCEFNCFTLDDDDFLIGYGLDYKQKNRNWKAIYAFE